MNRGEIILNHPLLDYVRNKGAKLARSGGSFITSACPLATHKPNHLCVSIEPNRQIWRCNDCGQGGSVIDWMMFERGQTAAEVLESFGEGASRFAGSRQNRFDRPEVSRERTEDSEAPPSLGEPSATYDYTDENGNLRFQVLRYDPKKPGEKKTFRQRQPDGDGWKWGLDGVERVPFNLPKVLTSQTVFVVEGEKDCQTLESMGFVATTNAGGSTSWLPAYATFLRGKDVIVIPDSDQPGANHADAVIASLQDKANSAKRLKLPHGCKDVSDYFENCTAEGMLIEETLKHFQKLIDETPHTLKPLPLYTITEMETHYRKFVRNFSTSAFDLSKFMPSFARISPLPMMPGELAVVLADTGVGKSLVLSAMARAAHPLATLFFELELPLDMMFARFVQMEMGCHHQDVLRDYQNNGEDSFVDNFSGLSHITVCPESGLTTQQIENYIERSELKIGKRPVIVFVDYAGLVHHAGAQSRYERVSATAEEMKVIAKRTETIIVMASQVARPAKDKKEHDVGLHDGKDSGSLENSAGLVLGLWRPDRDVMKIKVLKNTKGRAGDVIDVKFDGAKMRLEEIASENGSKDF